MKSLGSIPRTLAALTLLTVFHAAAGAKPVEVTLHVDESEPGSTLPSDFLGFSYEKNVLALDHFKSTNTAMVNLMRHLGNGVLRFGGNYVEITRWEPVATKSFSNEKSLISTREIIELYQFARASGWTVIHGLNLGANDPQMATIENLLSPTTAAEWRKLIGQHQQASKSAGFPFRVTEAGSASSGGKPGVSDVFASALWCADYLFVLAELGVAGVNFHGSFNCRGYTSFCALKDGGYHAHANYYGMLFFRQAALGRVIPLETCLNRNLNLSPSVKP